MIAPSSVLVMIPAYDGRLETATAGGLFSIAKFGMAKNLAFLDCCTGPPLARNICVNNFLRSDFQWLVFIDADIGFSADDFAILMDYPGAPPPLDQELHDAATLIDVRVPLKDSTETQFAKLPALVTAEYARKQDGAPPARLGLGFARIHRNVFTALDALNLESGEARIDAFMYEGQHVADYFLSGCSEHRWLGEDTGFFSLCRLAGIHPRVEQRCKLVHYGRKGYGYSPQLVAQ